MSPDGPAGASPWSQSATESTGHSEELRMNKEDFRLRSTSAEKAAGNALGPDHGHIKRSGKSKNSCFSAWGAAGARQAMPRRISLYPD